ncbi:MAG TPA: prepilin peptidase [Candidatus Binatia bacterium]|nr:prepilin peptidase [Candidatus Binatia bacterium]
MLLLAAFAFGACIGSFLNVCIHRLPADESVVRPGSRCPACARPIAWYDNVPIVSWLVLRARCRHCDAPISVRYPIVEAATGALAVLALLRFGPTLHAAVAFALSAALLLVTYVDVDHRFIPDEVSLPGILVGLGVAFVDHRGPTPAEAVAGVVLGGGVLWAVSWAYERATGVEGMGFGDVKLLAMIGAFLGWQAIPLVLLVAAVSGSAAGILVMLSSRARRTAGRVRRRLGVRAMSAYARRAARRTAIPFGPFLALGAALVLYRPDLTRLWG